MMERTVQVLATHCLLKQSSDIVASPGTMLAPALSTDREQQQQHILTLTSVKTAPAQRHATAASMGQQGTHTGTHNAHTYKHKCERILTGAHTHVHMHTYKHTYTRTRTYTNAQTYRYTHVHAHIRTHTHTHKCICTHALRA
jgi:hypothetical protein